jgi:hypothetical protein
MPYSKGKGEDDIKDLQAKRGWSQGPILKPFV